MSNTKPNYQLKAKVIENGLAQTQREISLTFYKEYQQDFILETTGELLELNKPMDYKAAKILYEYYMQNCPLEYLEAIKVNHAYRERKARLQNKINDMIQNNNCIFLTLTFTNDTLNSTSEDTRKKYVKRYLKSVSSQYVANIDYGAKKEREHYHAIVIGDKINYSFWHKYGAIKGEKIIMQDTTSIKLAKYVSKLTNHAIKETTRRNCVIYSR